MSTSPKAMNPAADNNDAQGTDRPTRVRKKPLNIEDVRRMAAFKAEERRAQYATIGSDESTDWASAKELFPRTPFPWHVLPEDISGSFQQLARSCATSPQPLPGIALCILASTLGRMVDISPKSSWVEPLILWYADVRSSGDGKTPPGNLLAGTIKQAQAKEYERFRQDETAYRVLPRKERERADPPAKPQGYYCTELTLEGLRDDLEGHPHGGLLVIQDELSSFISGQNQYKGGKGSDRESWLKLWDGHPARVVRVGRTVHITGARVSLFGGVQPGVFARAFKSDDGVYLMDGTVFRFLLTYEPSAYHELTPESWSDTAREFWETILHRAMRWTAGRVEEHGQSLTMLLDSEAQSLFLCWRNSLEQHKGNVPESFRGFFPKGYSYALRLAGLLHCMERFHQREEPYPILSRDDIIKGIETVEFYLRQTVSAMQLLESESSDFTPGHTGPQVAHLAETLGSLRKDVDSGWLAVGYVQERFNAGLPDEQKIKTPRAMGVFLRSLGLTIPAGLHDWNKRRRLSCMAWDMKTDSFIKNTSP
jgi:hypothetical protein